ncbi:MAG TPA: DUF3341 domain-containing protein [Phycisphaerales bacterium]|nr:DUF3341 domain-containing protein [Phycisphaerales bacterium]
MAHEMTATPKAKEPTRMFGMFAEFETPGAILEAAKKVREAGYKWWDCNVPFPVHGLDKAMGVRPTILPLLVFGGGLTGTLLAIALQVFTNSTNLSFWALVPVHGYPFLVSGKPFISGPAFVPVAFELTVLLASLTSFGAMMLLNGLPRHYHPVLKSPKMARATDDRFYLVIEARDPKYSPTKTAEFLKTLRPLQVSEMEA